MSVCKLLRSNKPCELLKLHGALCGPAFCSSTAVCMPKHHSGPPAKACQIAEHIRAIFILLVRDPGYVTSSNEERRKLNADPAVQDSWKLSSGITQPYQTLSRRASRIGNSQSAEDLSQIAGLNPSVTKASSGRATAFNAFVHPLMCKAHCMNKFLKRSNQADHHLS